MVYGEYGGKSTSYLTKRRGKLLGEIEALLNEDRKKLYELMEVERELTLRESE